MARKQAEISSNKHQLEQGDVRSARSRAGKAFSPPSLAASLSSSRIGDGIAFDPLISTGQVPGPAPCSLLDPSWPQEHQQPLHQLLQALFQLLFMPSMCLEVSEYGGQTLATTSIPAMCHIHLLYRNVSHSFLRSCCHYALSLQANSLEGKVHFNPFYSCLFLFIPVYSVPFTGLNH